MSKKQVPHQDYISFTKEMKKDYKILVPMMLQMHFKILCGVLRNFGYDVELLETSGPHIAEEGLRHVHNDACYPAIIVIGQFIDAIKSGKYDPDKTALVFFQTGGGCRASNYVSLLRKALKKAGYPQVPVVALSFVGLENHPGLSLTLPLIHKIVYAFLYADLLMLLVNQCRPYEDTPGSAQALADQWTERLADALTEKTFVSYKQVKENYRAILRDFAALPRTLRPAARVGIVGEIFVKYSPLANNELEHFLVSEGAEPVVPGLLDFFMYTVYANVIDYQLYGLHPVKYRVFQMLFDFFNRKKDDLIAIIEEQGIFEPPTHFKHVIELTKGYIGVGTKMGEGWLLTAEMLELAESGVENIVCTQPFGCLPNHICGKGMMRPIKERNPNVNIVAIDYDAGATKVNQENRLKLMLANAKKTDIHQKKS
ncbi:MAG: 2-hydroxyglutaryl-CoA dehydratase [Ruminococcaceae bacterium]|nr:2-hydroxyglutaryl-CoA dehydratase [Oscillospiraceae bacterium]